MKVGDRVQFTITAPHKSSTFNQNTGNGQTSKTTYGLPVKSSKTKEGELFPLNKTNFGYLAAKLGMNSDTWTGHIFDGVVIPQKNPNTSAPVLSWTIDVDSIK